HFVDQHALLAALRPQLHAGVSCLVKGSRSAGMDRVVDALRGDPTLAAVTGPGGAAHVA
ncbi:MAG: UDP-N-acetylmuramoyl-tripeptide--D-alanyl-D-alanine ligase, partial [Rhodanobacter sp.]